MQTYGWQKYFFIWLQENGWISFEEKIEKFHGIKEYAMPSFLWLFLFSLNLHVAVGYYKFCNYLKELILMPIEQERFAASVELYLMEFCSQRQQHYQYWQINLIVKCLA